MSALNSVTMNDRAADVQAERTAFAIPEELAARYQVRTIETPDSGERRVGLFLAGDRINPSLEIAHERIIAHKEDAETVASLVKLAKHNGWEKIDIEGSPEFRKAAWAAATREGLTVSGYEPTFAEREQAAAQRREDAQRRECETKWPTPAAEADMGRGLAAVEAAASAARSGERSTGEQAVRHEPRPEPQPVRPEPLRDENAVHRPENEELAELFRHGAADKIATDPRLANAREAQTVMELHIAEVFKGDAAQTAAANLESRKMISDVLARGLDIWVREPTQVRQIEPIKTLEMER